MADQLLRIQREYLGKLYASLPEDLETRLPARRDDLHFHFRAFGEDCTIGPEGVSLSAVPTGGAVGLLVALYAFHASDAELRLHPVTSFKQLKGSVPYHGAFAARSEQALAPHVPRIQEKEGDLMTRFSGHLNESERADFSFTLYPLPKVPLYYKFYLADEEFPASATCLLASNAERFLPLDGLADVAEYTAKRIIEWAA